MQAFGIPERLSKLFALLALAFAFAFAWTYRTGEQLDSQQPILFKKRYNISQVSVPIWTRFPPNCLLNLSLRFEEFLWALRFFVLYLVIVLENFITMIIQIITDRWIRPNSQVSWNS